MTQPPVPHDPYAASNAGPAAPGAVPGTATAAPGPVMDRPHPLTPVVKGWMALVGLALVWGRDALQEAGRHRDRRAGAPSPTWLGIDLAVWVVAGAVLAYLVVTGVVGWLQWRTTRFVVDDHEVRIEHRLVRHTSDRVPFTKVQSVDVVQPLAARLLGLAQVRIDVGAGRPKTIEYLGRERAYRMRDYLVARAHGREVTVAEAAGATVAGPLGDVAGHEQVLLAVPPARLATAALLSTGFVTTLLAGVAVLAGSWWWDGSLPLAWLVPIATGLLGVVRSSVVKQWNHRLVAADGALKVTRGMTSLVSQTLPTSRVQAVVVTRHLLWRPFGLYRVQVDVLGYRSGEDGTEQASDVLLPAGTWDEVLLAVRSVWPGFDLGAVELARPSRRARWMEPLQWSSMGWARTDDVMVARWGWFVQRTSVVHHARVQSAHLAQGPLERRLGLADVVLNTSNALGDVRCVHLDEAVARQLVLDEMGLARAARRREAAGAPGAPGASAVPVAGLDEVEDLGGSRVPGVLVGEGTAPGLQGRVAGGVGEPHGGRGEGLRRGGDVDEVGAQPVE